MISTNRGAPTSIRWMLSLVFWGTILVILAGSIVRTTGSGLGCPDWPKCFGTWIPPVSIDDLPSDYKTRFAIGGREIADFDAFKTWIEYLNRLLGALLGVFLVALSLMALAKRRILASRIFWGIHAALVLVIVQGGLGAIVVATHLHGQTISLHLGLAIALAVLLNRLYVSSDGQDVISKKEKSSNHGFRWARLVYVLALVQLVLGTEVRKTIDHLVHDFVSLPRAEWAKHLDWNFLVHRSLAIVFVFASIAWYRQSLRDGLQLKSHFGVLALCVLSSILSGIVMRELGFPAWAQPVHLVFGVLIFVQVDRVYRFYSHKG